MWERWSGSATLARDPIVIAVEVVEIGRQYLETSIGNMAAVEIQWRARDAHTRAVRVSIPVRERWS
jgi:hypothetical protein